MECHLSSGENRGTETAYGPIAWLTKLSAMTAHLGYAPGKRIWLALLIEREVEIYW